MAKQRTLVRLLRLRQIEEEQSRLEVESAARARDRARWQWEQAREESAEGRRHLVAGILQQSPVDRLGALVEMEQARRRQERSVPVLEAAQREVERQRAEFLFRRTARRQIETLAGEERIRADAAVARRAQQMLDDWYGRRTRETEASPGRRAAKRGSGPAPGAIAVPGDRDAG